MGLYVLFLILGFFCSGSLGYSIHYYDMIHDINDGVDYYKVLNVAPSASGVDIKKSYRTLSRLYHPDKNKAVDAELQFIRVQTAYDVLSDPELKEEYDELRLNGVPWQEQYYGQYAHRYGMPQHDIRYVLLGFILLTTVAKHLYHWYRHEVLKGYAKRTARYKQKKKRTQSGKNG